VLGWSEWAVVVAVGLIVFFDWVPTPLNRNIRGAAARDRLIGDLVHVPIGVLVVISIQQGWRWVVLAGAIWYSIVLVIGIVNWWVPWLTGVTRGEITEEAYEREYAHNVTVLPRLGRSRIVPDVQHTLIHLAVLAAAVGCWLTFFGVDIGGG
jgi:hypothetical protein